MPEESPLTREAFLQLAKKAGLDVNSPHMDQLYPYVREVLVGFEALKGLDVAGAEPDMAFIPGIPATKNPPNPLSKGGSGISRDPHLQRGARGNFL